MRVCDGVTPIYWLAAVWQAACVESNTHAVARRRLLLAVLLSRLRAAHARPHATNEGARRRWRTNALVNLNCSVLLLGLLGVVLMRTGQRRPVTKEMAMKSVELKNALRLITKVLADPEVEPDVGDQLRRAKRELEVVARSGKLEGPRVFLAVELIAIALQRIVDDDATPMSE